MRSDSPGLNVPTRFRLGNLFLDLVLGRLQDADGKPVDLRPKAYAVLRHLAEHGGRVTSKEELFEAVWPGVIVTDDSLVQAIGDIRRVLGPTAQHMLKTVPRRGYLLLTAPMAAVERAPAAAALQETARPLTIAVLPFENGSTDGTHDWIGQGLSLGIASALTRLSGLPVLWIRARTRGADAARDSPATHLLAASVQADGERVRATVQLTEARSDRILWSERYERPLSELLPLEDEVIARTVQALQVRVSEGEQARSRIHPHGNLRAWELATRGYALFETGGPVPLREARQSFEQALALDPDYAWARSFLAATCFLEARFGFASDPQASLGRAFDEANRALAADPELPDAHSTLGSIQLARRCFAEAVACGRRATGLAPNHAEVHAVLAQTMLAIGDWPLALDLSRKALRLSLRPPSWYWVPHAYALVFLGRQDEAIEAGERMRAAAESPFLAQAAVCCMVVALVQAGRHADARQVWTEACVMDVASHPERVGADLLFEDERHARWLADALHAVVAGCI